MHNELDRYERESFGQFKCRDLIIIRNRVKMVALIFSILIYAITLQAAAQSAQPNIIFIGT